MKQRRQRSRHAEGSPPVPAVCINRYSGWYASSGRIDEGLAAERDGLHDELDKPIIVMEFGADTLAGVHATPPEMWSEAYQVEVLRGHPGVAAHLLRERWGGKQGERKGPDSALWARRGGPPECDARSACA